ncbi:MAG TPA: RlmE family RNA methyltransferase [Polyangia bacterium]
MGLRDRTKRHDTFFKKARDQGFAARSIFKLEDIDRRFRLIHNGERVLDLGCRPGSWMQYAVKAVGPHGIVVGLDRQALPSPVPGTKVLIGDVYTITDEALLDGQRAYDVVLSDMAPDTTGIRSTDQARSAALVEEALARAERLLAPGGVFVAKIFQGPDVAVIRKRMEARFAEVHLVKPEASRSSSTELYLVGKGFA